MIIITTMTITFTAFITRPLIQRPWVVTFRTNERTTCMPATECLTLLLLGQQQEEYVYNW